MKLFTFLILAVCFSYDSLFAESSWYTNNNNYVVFAHLKEKECSNSTYHCFIKFCIVISKDKKIERIDEVHFNILDTDPKILTVSMNEISGCGIKAFRFDDGNGIIEIDFNEKKDDVMIFTSPKLIITRGHETKSENSKNVFSCDSTLNYQLRFTDEWLKAQGDQGMMNKWLKHEFNGIDEIVLPSARIMP